MILIVGLGNPGKNYENTRHNIGFLALDALAKELDISFREDKKSGSYIAEHAIIPNGQKKIRIALVKPQKFMNNSGEVVKKVANFYKTELSNIWVIHDDIDIELGLIRIRLGGSSAGQKGVQSIIESLGTGDFYRFRFGIKPRDKINEPTEVFVLKKFSKEESHIIDIKISELTQFIKDSLGQKPEEKTI